MRTRRLAFGLIAMAVAACAPTLPPNRVAVAEFRSPAGTYTGTMNEASELNRSVRLTLEPNGAFELSVGSPKGYNELLGRGKVATGQGWGYEGDGRRAIVLTRGDGSTKTTVSKTRP